MERTPEDFGDLVALIREYDMKVSILVVVERTPEVITFRNPSPIRGSFNPCCSGKDS